MFKRLCSPLQVFLLSFLFTKIYANFTEYVDDDNNIIGLKNDFEEICLQLSFTIDVINFNDNTTFQFELLDSRISGKCAQEKKDSAYLFAKYEEEQKTRELKFYFQTNAVKVKHGDEIRWQLNKLIYKERDKYGQLSVFESDNSSVIMSAPLNQKYICKDKINVTLHNEDFDDIIVVFSPEIDLQPYGLKSNFYLCERTRKRTLKEAFNSRMTIFSGVVMGLAAIGSMIGHFVRRHFIPERKQIYETIVGT